jgi:hypothetical protein
MIRTKKDEKRIRTRQPHYSGKEKRYGFVALVYKRMEIDGFKMIRVEYNDLITGDLKPVYYVINREGFWMISNKTQEMVRLSDDSVDILGYTIKNFESLSVKDASELAIIGSSDDFILLRRTLTAEQQQELEKSNKASVKMPWRSGSGRFLSAKHFRIMRRSCWSGFSPVKGAKAGWLRRNSLTANRQFLLSGLVARSSSGRN